MRPDRRKYLVAALGGLLAPALSARAHDRLHEVAIRDFVFTPGSLTVRAGDHIRFTNHDLAPHTATALDGSWDTGELLQGQSIELTVSDDWTGDYFCAFHPAMTGSLLLS